MSELRLYLDSLIFRFPTFVIDGLLIILLIGLFIIFVIRRKNTERAIAVFLLTEYVCLLYLSTVVFRMVKNERKFKLLPFWSYGRHDLVVENFMNVLAFIPVGLMLGCTFRSMNWWKALLIGGCISVTIETLQLIFKRGFSEVDDVMHNTLGCMIGYGVYALGKEAWLLINKMKS